MKVFTRPLPRPPGCTCPRTVLADKCGNILELQTCRSCTRVALDSLRGVEYAGAYMTCDDAVKHVLLKQKEFFSLQSMHSPRNRQNEREPRERVDDGQSQGCS